MLQSVTKDQAFLAGTIRSSHSFMVPDKDHMLRSVIRDHVMLSCILQDHMLQSVTKDHALLSGTEGSRATLATKRSRAQLLCALYSTLLKVEKRGERTFSSRYGAGLRRFP
jgi:hypothetical protein